jgi:hypothetical protein
MEGITRRDFLGKAAAGTAGIVMAPVLGKFNQTSLWPAEASKIRFHLIGRPYRSCLALAMAGGHRRSSQYFPFSPRQDERNPRLRFYLQLRPVL